MERVWDVWVVGGALGVVLGRLRGGSSGVVDGDGSEETTGGVDVAGALECAGTEVADEGRWGIAGLPTPSNDDGSLMGGEVGEIRVGSGTLAWCVRTVATSTSSRTSSSMCSCVRGASCSRSACRMCLPSMRLRSLKMACPRSLCRCSKVRWRGVLHVRMPSVQGSSQPLMAQTFARCA